jgi:phosphate:Na+ symporter
MNQAAAQPIEIGALVTGLGGGLALFLYGMQRMTEALTTVAGGGMKNLLGRLTRNRFTAALAGTITTAVIQSSSATTVLVVAFVSTGLLNLSQAIGVIIGANVGTTVTAQIIAFEVHKYGLLMIAVGFLMDLGAKAKRIKQWGVALMGLGLVFFGMELMSAATGPLRSWPPFIGWMQELQQPLVGIAVGMLFTAVVQSSSATTGIVIVLASQGLLSLESGIGVIFGANIGTCVTAVISAVGRPREAAQAAVVHVIFNVGGVVLWMFFIPQVAEIVRSFSPVAEDLAGAAKLAAETPRQIANAHTLFNVGNALLFIWFTQPLARLVNRLVPERPQPKGALPRYLDPLFLEQPEVALDQVRRELVRLAERDRTMLEDCLAVVTVGSRSDVAALANADDEVDALHGAIVTYLGKLSQQDLVGSQPKQLHGFIGIANNLENFADVIVSNLVDHAEKRLDLGVTVSPSTIRVLEPLHRRICKNFDLMLRALQTGDVDVAWTVAHKKKAVKRLAEDATEHLARRLIANEPNRLATFQVETDIIENLQRLNAFTRLVGRQLLEIQGSSGAVRKRKTTTEKAHAPPPDETL